MATASGQIQPLKIPDAVVALAQAAAKANGETEKYLPGWPLFSPPKMQLTKCAKCPREFCSSVALRRHSRVHRRALKIDKDFPKNRDHVAAFWDKLTVDQAQTIMSLEDVVIEGVKGLSNSILTALSSWMCKPGYTSLPLAYARAGNELLDLIQTRASRLPISSNKLFYMLDEGSENTFLCTKTADAASIQKYLFDGEVEKVATELKNVVACTSYILEQKLVEAWSADKAAEALRCQKLLVEEEDAAQKRQAEIMERKRMKKLRQKEQISKDLKDEEDAMVRLPEMTDGAADYPEIQSLDAISGPGLCEEEDQRYLQLPTHCTFDSGREMDTVAVTREQPVSTSDVDRLDNARQAGIVSGSGIPSKHPPSARHSRHRDPNGSSASNRSGTWAWKVRADVEERCPEAKLDAEGGHETVLGTDKSARLLIGSISVPVQNEKCLQGLQCLNDPPAPESHSDIVNHTLVSHAKDGCEDTNGGSTTQTAENLSPSSVVTEQSGLNNAELASGGGDSQGAAVFSSKEAAVFLSQRWKEAMGGDHVKLVVCSEN